MFSALFLLNYSVISLKWSFTHFGSSWMWWVSPESSYSEASSLGGRINELEGISTSQLKVCKSFLGFIIMDGVRVETNKLFGWLPVNCKDGGCFV